MTMMVVISDRWMIIVVTDNDSSEVPTMMVTMMNDDRH